MKIQFARYLRVLSICLFVIILGTVSAGCPTASDPYDEYGTYDDSNYDDSGYSYDDPEGTLGDNEDYYGDDPGNLDGTPGIETITPSIELAMTPVVTEMLQPSAEDQQVTWNNQVTVTVPGGLLENDEPLTISTIETDLPEKVSEFTPLATYDVTLGDLHDFDQPLTIEMAYDPAQLNSDLPPELSLCAEWWDGSQSTWWRAVSQVDTQRNVVVIKTNHLTPWRISMWWRGDKQYPSTHFIVVWNPAEKPTINKVDQDPESFAKKVSGYLEDAYTKYYDQGYYVAPANDTESRAQKARYKIDVETGRTWVVINQSVVESETGTLSGDITLKSYFKDDDEIKQDTAHELFHTTHLRKSGMTTYLQSQWWADASADYAATRIAWDNLPGMPLVSPDYFRSSLTMVDSIHEYETSRLIEYLVSDGIPFNPLFDEMSKNVPTTTLLDTYVKKVKRLSLLEQYGSFLAYVLFDSDGPIQQVALSPSLLKGATATKGAPDNMDPTTKNISCQLLINGGYCAQLWGFKVEPAGATPSRTLKIELSPLTSDSLVPDKVIFYIYTLNNDTRVSGGAKLMDSLTSFKPSTTITTAAGDVVYVLGVVASNSGSAVQVDVSEANRPTKIANTIAGKDDVIDYSIDWTISGSDIGVNLAGGLYYEAYTLVGKTARLTISIKASAPDKSYTSDDSSHNIRYHGLVLHSSEADVFSASGNFPYTYSASGNTIIIDFTFTDPDQYFKIIISYDYLYDELWYDLGGNLTNEYDDNKGTDLVFSGATVLAASSQEMSDYDNRIWANPVP